MSKEFIYAFCNIKLTERDCSHTQCQENGICNESAVYLLQDTSWLIAGLITLEKPEHEKLKSMRIPRLDMRPAKVPGLPTWEENQIQQKAFTGSSQLWKGNQYNSNKQMYTISLKL